MKNKRSKKLFERLNHPSLFEEELKDSVIIANLGNEQDKDNNNIVFNAINGAIKTIDKRGDVVISERIPSYLNYGKDYISQRVNRYFDGV